MHADFHNAVVQRGVGRCDPPRASKLRVVELSGQKQRTALDEYSPLVVRFLGLGQYLIQLGEVKCQIFAKSTIFQIYFSISQKLLVVATQNFHKRVSRLILNKMKCLYRLWMEYL